MLRVARRVRERAGRLLDDPNSGTPSSTFAGTSGPRKTARIGVSRARRRSSDRPDGGHHVGRAGGERAHEDGDHRVHAGSSSTASSACS